MYIYIYIPQRTELDSYMTVVHSKCIIIGIPRICQTSPQRLELQSPTVQQCHAMPLALQPKTPPQFQRPGLQVVVEFEHISGGKRGKLTVSNKSNIRIMLNSVKACGSDLSIYWDG